MKNTIAASYHRIPIKAAALFTAFAVFALFFAVFGVHAYADDTNGISVSDSSLSPGDSFTVYVTIPAARANADSASLRIEFDSDAFEPAVKQDWAPAAITNAASGSGEGFIALSAGNSSRAIDLSSGMTIPADFTVKSSAPSGRYGFTLTKSSFSCAENDGVTIQELWEPRTLTAYVDIGGSGQNTEPVQPDSSGEDTAQGGGIRLSGNRFAPGEIFYAYIDIPAADTSADTLSIRTEFSSDVFEVISWEPELPASAAVNSGSGFFAVSASSADRILFLARLLRTSRATTALKPSA